MFLGPLKAEVGAQLSQPSISCQILWIEHFPGCLDLPLLEAGFSGGKICIPEELCFLASPEEMNAGFCISRLSGWTRFGPGISLKPSKYSGHADKMRQMQKLARVMEGEDKIKIVPCFAGCTQILRKRRQWDQTCLQCLCLSITNFHSFSRACFV